MSPLVRHGAARRAYDGARHAVIPAFGAGAIVGLVSGVPILLCAGAGAMLGLVVGSLLGLRRPI
ncbi:MAG TPA: hypothetical protein VH165_09980 [Kofleriaceae bacterium]|jgi:hypothetical protein|nr:hypothetical protein [Kofleriaceae bacterium]